MSGDRRGIFCIQDSNSIATLSSVNEEFMNQDTHEYPHPRWQQTPADLKNECTPWTPPGMNIPDLIPQTRMPGENKDFRRLAGASGGTVGQEGHARRGDAESQTTIRRHSGRFGGKVGVERSTW